METISHILVPLNGNPTDDEALQLACVTAKRTKAKITVVHVIEVPRALPLDADTPSLSEESRDMLDHAEEVAQQLGCSVQAEALQARAAGPALVDEARAARADLIIIGLPNRVRFGSFHLGATSNYVLNHAPCRVWLAREKQMAAAEESV